MKYIFSVISLTIIYSNSIFAQLNVSNISLNFGQISTTNVTSSDKNNHVLYPEISIGGQLFLKYFEWNVYFSAWKEDNITPDFITEGPMYLAKGNIYGLRTNFHIKRKYEKFAFPIHIIGGISKHDNRYKRVYWGEGHTAEYIPDKKISVYTGEIGLGVNIQLLKNISLSLEGIKYNSLHKTNEAFENNQNLYKAGLKYDYNK